MAGNNRMRACRPGSQMRLGDGIVLNLDDTRRETAQQFDHDVLLQIGPDFQPT